MLTEQAPRGLVPKVEQLSRMFNSSEEGLLCVEALGNNSRFC